MQSQFQNQTGGRLLMPLLTGLIVLLLTACGGSESAENAGSLRNIVIALEPDKDPDAMLADQAALTTFVAEESELPVEVTIPMSSAVIREGLRNGTVDVAYVSSTVGVRLADAGVAHLLLATEIDGRPYYMSYWLGRADSPYGSVADLRGKPIAFASRTSTSGYMIPMWDLHQQGLLTDAGGGPEEFFGEGNVSYGVGYVSAVERVLQGQAEAAAVSYYVYDKDKHLSPAQRQQLKVIDSQGPVPTHVLVVRSGIDAETVAELRRVFLAMNTDAAELRDRIFGAPFVEADEDTHYAVTREALAIVERLAQ